MLWSRSHSKERSKFLGLLQQYLRWKSVPAAHRSWKERVGICSICSSFLKTFGWSFGTAVADSKVPVSGYAYKAVLNSVQHTESFVSAFDCLCWSLTTRQPLWVILCRLPEKGRREIEEIVEEMKERNREKKRNTNESEEIEEIKTAPSTLTCYKNSRPYPAVSQYQLDAPVILDTRHRRTTQPPPSCLLLISSGPLCEVSSSSILVTHLEDLEVILFVHIDLLYCFVVAQLKFILILFVCLC